MRFIRWLKLGLPRGPGSVILGRTECYPEGEKDINITESSGLTFPTYPSTFVELILLMRSCKLSVRFLSNWLKSTVFATDPKLITPTMVAELVSDL